MNKEDYSIERLSGYNLGDLARLHKEVYGAPRPDKYFEKKYDTAFTGVAYTGFIAYDSEHLPIAYFGVIPCLMQSGTNLFLAAQAADAMTHPRFRKEGLFIELSEMSFELCRALSIRLLFGFPNQNSYPLMMRHLGWTEAGKMNRFVIRTGEIWNRWLPRNSPGRQKKILDRLALPEPMIRNSVIEEGYTGVYRDKAYMHYKTYSDNYVVNLDSARLWIKTGSELIIGDIMLKENGSKPFFEEVKGLAKELGLSKISFQVSEDCDLHKLFANGLNPVPSFPVLFKDLDSGLTPHTIRFTFADIDIF